MIYPIGSSGQRLIFSSSVIDHLNRHRQTRPWRREAGGQLFGRFVGADILVEDITGPRRSDSRSRHAYRPDRAAEQREILERHNRGLCFVGDWHSHAERIPRPSSCDLESMHDMFRRSKHALNAFALVIVGTSPPPQGLYVAIANGADVAQLQACAIEERSSMSR